MLAMYIFQAKSDGFWNTLQAMYKKSAESDSFYNTMQAMYKNIVKLVYTACKVLWNLPAKNT